MRWLPMIYVAFSRHFDYDKYCYCWRSITHTFLFWFWIAFDTFHVVVQNYEVGENITNVYFSDIELSALGK